MQILRRAMMLAFGLLTAAATASAQAPPDSVFSVSSGGFGLFRVNVNGGALWRGDYTGVGTGARCGSGRACIPQDGAGTRMMWYPEKAAFRAGYVNGTQWDDANIGEYSVAIGQDVRASASNAVAFGLRSTAAQVTSFAVGEDNTASGASSVAFGYHAHTNARQGSFVFGDRSTVDTIRAGVNHSANWRVSGGFRIFTSSNLSTGVTIQSGNSVSNWGQSSAVISTSTGALLTTGGVWQNASDVNRKHLFRDVSGEDVLLKLRALPVTSWSYKVENDGVRHIGPTAQDFYATFRLGSDPLSIGTVDADGVALVGVKALEARTTDLREELTKTQRLVEELIRERAVMLERLEKLEALNKPAE